MSENSERMPDMPPELIEALRRTRHTPGARSVADHHRFRTVGIDYPSQTVPITLVLDRWDDQIRSAQWNGVVPVVHIDEEYEDIAKEAADIFYTRIRDARPVSLVLPVLFFWDSSIRRGEPLNREWPHHQFLRLRQQHTRPVIVAMMPNKIDSSRALPDGTVS